VEPQWDPLMVGSTPASQRGKSASTAAGAVLSSPRSSCISATNCGRDHQHRERRIPDRGDSLLAQSIDEVMERRDHVVVPFLTLPAPWPGSHHRIT
jgi:hypothetical protein